jgi:antitoxin Phd
MTERSWSVRNAKHRFIRLLRAARRTSQAIGNRGKPAVIVAEYERLQHPEYTETPSFADNLLAMPQDDGTFPHRNIRTRDLEF